MGLVSSEMKVARLKRELVRQAVQENLDLIAGRAPAGTRRAARRRWAARGVLGGLALSAGLLASAYALNGHGGPLLSWERRGAEDLAERPAAEIPVGAPAAGEPSRAPLEATAAPASRGASPDPSSLPAAAVLEAIPARLDHEVFPLAVRRVVVDPGHGGSSLGTRHPSGLSEKDVTLDIGQRLKRLLLEQGLEVILTRESDLAVPLAERARIANQAAADLFVSIHVNWIEDGGSRGVETYFLGPTDDPFLSRLAASENQDSGYAMADMRLLLDRILSGVRAEQSRDLARGVQAALFHSLSKLNPQLRDRGVKTAPFLVLVETRMPAVLAEVSCLSNEREAELLGKPLYRQYIAEALAHGIAAYAELGSSIVQKGS